MNEKCATFTDYLVDNYIENDLLFPSEIWKEKSYTIFIVKLTCANLPVSNLIHNLINITKNIQFFKYILHITYILI